MAENTVYVRRSSREITSTLRHVVDSVTGRQPATDASNTLLVRIGLALLANIKIAFLVKAKGGTDEAGERWPPLKRETVAYSRRAPGLPPPSVRAASAPSYALTDAQRTRWWELCKGGGPAYAWWQLRREDPSTTTLLQTYGDTPVEILRDTGLLLNSLSPGVAFPEEAKSDPPHVENQVFRRQAGEVIVGTNRKWAAVHHFGSPARGIPQRRLWPDPEKWPASWWDAILTEARAGLIDIAIQELQRGLT